MKIKKGDQVKILRGEDRGKIGSILHAFPSLEKVTVEGFNLVKKRTRPRRQGQKGEMVSVPRPIPVSNVMIICRNCKKPTRIGMSVDGDKKSRVCKKCGSNI